MLAGWLLGFEGCPPLAKGPVSERRGDRKGPAEKGSSNGWDGLQWFPDCQALAKQFEAGQARLDGFGVPNHNPFVRKNLLIIFRLDRIPLPSFSYFLNEGNKSLGKP